MRALDRPREDGDLRHLEVLPAVRERFLTQRLDEDLKRLGEAFLRRVRWRVECEMRFRVEARAGDAELESASAQHVERGGALGNADRMVEREDPAGRADPEPAGPGGDRGHQDEWRGVQQPPVAEVALGQEDAGEAEFLRQARLLDDPRVRARTRAEHEDSHGPLVARVLVAVPAHAARAGRTCSEKRSMEVRQRAWSIVK